jgi:hypothetical protein
MCYVIFLSAGGMYMMEVDRVLRPGGYWILSGPPINWNKYYQTWKRSKQDAEGDQQRIENIAKMLCWDKIHEKEDIAIWQKKANSHSCHQMSGHATSMCKVQDADDVWYGLLFIQIYALFKLSESFICMFATSNVNFV